MRYRLGIVLSGGGSRGLAHAGVLRALAENAIQPDCVAGTSAGALVGALDASGRSAVETLRFFDDANPFRLSRLALGKPGVIDSEKIVGAFESWFPEDSFAALVRPLFVTGTDLVSGRPPVWSSCPLVRPLRALVPDDGRPTIPVQRKWPWHPFHPRDPGDGGSRRSPATRTRTRNPAG